MVVSDIYSALGVMKPLSKSAVLSIGQKTFNRGNWIIYQYDLLLSCFQEFEKPIVLYQEQLNIPFDMLDLCVLNCDGQAKIEVECLDNKEKLILQRYTPNFGVRIDTVINTLKQVYESKIAMMRYWEPSSDVFDECAKMYMKQ